MASIGDLEESLYESQRPSLLDAAEDRNRTLNKKGLLHRLVLISKMNHNNFNDIGQYYEKFFKDLTAVHQREQVTGLLLLYPKHCVHIIESAQETLTDLIKDLHRGASSEEELGHMEKSKIVIVSHDIPHRLYQQWGYRILDIEAPNLDEYDPSDEPEGLVLETLIQLLKLGAYINKQPKMGMKNTLESLHEKVPELLPQQDVIGYLLENDNDATISLESHLDKYHKPYDVTLNSELVWPMPVKLFPYN